MSNPTERLEDRRGEEGELMRLAAVALLSLASRCAAQCPDGGTSGCAVAGFTCVCTDTDGIDWDLQALRGEVATTGPNAGGGEWDYRFDVCGDVSAGPIAPPGCTIDVQAIRQDGTECQMLAAPQEATRPVVTATADGISLCYEFGTATPRSLTVVLVCDESAGDGEPGEVDGDGDAVSVDWDTGAVCGGGVRCAFLCRCAACQHHSFVIVCSNPSARALVCSPGRRRSPIQILIHLTLTQSQSQTQTSQSRTPIRTLIRILIRIPIFRLRHRRHRSRLRSG